MVGRSTALPQMKKLSDTSGRWRDSFEDLSQEAKQGVGGGQDYHPCNILCTVLCVTLSPNGPKYVIKGSYIPVGIGNHQVV